MTPSIEWNIPGQWDIARTFVQKIAVDCGKTACNVEKPIPDENDVVGLYILMVPSDLLDQL